MEQADSGLCKSVIILLSPSKSLWTVQAFRNRQTACELADFRGTKIGFATGFDALLSLNFREAALTRTYVRSVSSIDRVEPPDQVRAGQAVHL